MRARLGSLACRWLGVASWQRWNSLIGIVARWQSALESRVLASRSECCSLEQSERLDGNQVGAIVVDANFATGSRQIELELELELARA